MPPRDASILIATDDAGLVQQVERCLSRDKATVVRAGGEEAIRLAVGRPFSVFLVDLSSASFNGLGLCRALKADIRTLQVPLLTFADASRPGARSARPSFLETVPKPCPDEVLRLKLGILLRSRAGQGDAAEDPPRPDEVLLSRVEDRIRRIQELGACPYVVTKILRISQSSKSGARELATVIGADHALTAKLLKIANSAFYGTQGRITQISQAVTRIGFRGVLELAMGISVLEAFRKSMGKGGLEREGFWRHSLAVALASRRLALYIQYPAYEEAFVCGLLHDVGKPLLSECFPKEYRQAIDLAASMSVPIRNAEREVFGAEHGFFGAMLLSSWGLPVSIITAIGSHHHIERLLNLEDPQQRDLTRIVHIADALVKAAGLGNAGDSMIESTPPDVLRETSRPGFQAAEIISEVEGELSQYEQFLGILREAPSSKPGPTGLEGKSVHVLLGARQRVSASALAVWRAGAKVQVWDQPKTFEEAVRQGGVDAVLIDTGMWDASIRVLDRLEERLLPRVLCLIDASHLAEAERETTRRACLAAKPCDVRLAVARLAGQAGGEAA